MHNKNPVVAKFDGTIAILYLIVLMGAAATKPPAIAGLQFLYGQQSMQNDWVMRF